MYSAIISTSYRVMLLSTREMGSIGTDISIGAPQSAAGEVGGTHTMVWWAVLGLEIGTRVLTYIH